MGLHTPPWPLPRDTLSPSSIGTFIQCAEKYRIKYVLGQRDQFGVSALVGNAIHAAQERNYRVKVVNQRGISLPESEDAYLEAFEKEVDEAGGYSEIDWRIKDHKVRPGKAKDMGRTPNRLYHDTVAPTIQPIAVEQWIKIKVPGVYPEIIGKLDLVTLAAMFDYKFGRQTVAKPRPDWLLAAGIYSLSNPDLPFGWHTGRWNGDEILTPATTPALWYQPQPGEVLEALIRSYANAIIAYYERFGPDEPWPGTGKSHTFACDFCPAHPSKGGTCFWWKGWKPPVRKEGIML